MTREEFLSLPPAVAMRVLIDCLDENAHAALKRAEKPKLPLPPKYDEAIYRQGGVQWASETDLEGLRFWQLRAQNSARKGGEWAEKDQKKADALTRWITWRECYPGASWSGERNRAAVTAPAPSSRPAVHPRTGGQRQAAPPPEDDFDPNTF